MIPKLLSKKNIIFTTLFFLTSIFINAQNSVTIGTGTGSGTFAPIATWYNSSGTESIYTAAEIGRTGTISKIGYTKASGNSTVSPNVKVYMKTRTDANLGTASYFIGGISSYTLVYSGTLPNNSTTGLMEITLSTPFNYSNASQNLSVLVVGTTCIDSGRPQFRYTTTSARMTANYNDGQIGCDGTATFNDFSPFSPVLERPNLTLSFSTLSTDTFQDNASVLTIVKNNSLEISSENKTIKNVSVYDLTGRKLVFTNVNSQSAHIDLNFSKQILIVKMITEDNLEITKKIIL